MYSIIGNRIFTGIKDEITLEINGQDIFNLLEKFISKHKGAFILCFISYDLKNNIEKLKSENSDNIQFPLIRCIVANEIKEFKSLDNISTKYSDSNHISISFEPEINKEEYISIIKKIKGHIQKGDIYETNFCYQWNSKVTNFNGFSIFNKLYKLTEAPFCVYADLDDHVIISASPERFIRKKGDQLLTQPMKGTSKRSKNLKEDTKLINQLKESPKEISENIMIVDLVRNDLSKIAAKKTVQVEKLCKINSFKNIHQMISDVSCQLKQDISFTDIIKATFPMGSMTGVPKIRAMELMEKYEVSKRGLYSGTIGLIFPNGDFDLNVIIRTLLYNKKNQNLSFMVGGAITIESDPEEEHEETLTKAKAILDSCK